MVANLLKTTSGEMSGYPNQHWMTGGQFTLSQCIIG